MAALFPDHPEVITNTVEICDKIERYTIDRGHVLPKFQIDPDFLADIDNQLEKYKGVIDAGRCDEKGNDRGEEFRHSVAFLCHLCYKGAQERYGDVLDDVTADRLDFELKTISRMGFPDYFLIVQDYIAAARAQGISVGPGRGSAAGSAVAYCLGITNLDPIKYDLLFERFLNPERVSMPDIDVDFDDDGRYRVIQYVQDRYGVDHVSHVITFGTMAAKGAIKDVARISRLPLEESNRLTKMIPDKPITITETSEVELKEDEVPEEGDKIIEKDGKRFKVVKKEHAQENTMMRFNGSLMLGLFTKFSAAPPRDFLFRLTTIFPHLRYIPSMSVCFEVFRSLHPTFFPKKTAFLRNSRAHSRKTMSCRRL